MKILIASDLHLGYGGKSEREIDSFLALRELLRVIKEENCKLILLAGDIFDVKIPKPEAWAIMLKFLKKLREEGRECIAISGNHERRGGNLINPVQSLDKAGLLKYLHCEECIFPDLKIAIYGMSYVPDKYASLTLKEWNPKPKEGYFNILMLHQNIYPFMYSELEEVSLKIEDLPKGFDLIINGHIHYKIEKKIDNFTLLIPGSLILIQLNKIESKESKGCYILDLEKKELKFREITIREFYYEEFSSLEELEERIKEIIERNRGLEKPIAKFVVKGIKGVDLGLIERKYKDKILLYFKKELSKEIEKAHKEIADKRTSLEERIKEILKNKVNLEKTDIYELIDALKEENLNEVKNILRREYDKKD